MLAVSALLLQALLDATRTSVKQQDYELKISAAEKAEAAFTTIRQHRRMESASLDLVNDPAGTGLIGPEFSLITNARGDLESKLTSLNPNFAGLFVQFFSEARLKPGDKVAVALSGSFPGLNIGLYAALDAMDLDPVVITSVGASMWGANDPEFTWLDMESLFAQEDIFTVRSSAATYGGGDDMGRGLSPSGREFLQAAIERNGVPLLTTENIQDAIEKRQDFFLSQVPAKPVSAYVNIGGGVASIGSSHNKVLLPTGLAFNLSAHNWPRKGNLILFAERGVPTIHMLGIVGQARQHGLPVAPDFQPQPGEGEIFMRSMYRLPLAMGILAVYCLLCVFILAPEIRHGLFDKLGRKTSSPILPVFWILLVCLVMMAPSGPAQAKTRWIEVSPQEGISEVCLDGDGQQFQYEVVEDSTPLVFSINGPRKIKFVSRYLFAEGDPATPNFSVTILVDGTEAVRKTFRAKAHGSVEVCQAETPASTLRRVLLDLPKGKHEVMILAEADGSGQVCGRLFRETRKKSTGTVPFQPQQYGSVAKLQFESGRLSTYYHFDHGNPLAFELTGPTELKVYTRLDFDKTMNGDQAYGLEVWRDGELWHTFQFHTTKLSSATYLDRPDILPGARQQFKIDVPRGKHSYEVRCLRPTRCGATARIRIPKKDLETRP